jgi:allophanate hydrolase subunit 2
LRTVNLALGNAEDAAAIEFALGTMVLEALDDATLCVAGASASISVDGGNRGTNRVVRCRAGSQITIAPPRTGLRTYVAVPGGFECKKILGSASGILVRQGDVLISQVEPTETEETTVEAPSSLRPRALRVIAIGDASWMSGKYTVGRNLDRVGIRLEGPQPDGDLRSGRSEPSVFGAIQVTEDKTLIIHGPDGPTIGGYRKIGCIVSEDLDRVGQLAPGDPVQFERSNQR